MIGLLVAAGLIAALGFAIFDDNDNDGGSEEPNENDGVVYEGTEGDDLLQGTAGAEIFLGDDGNDRVDADRGNDTVEGDAGNDRLFGGPGDDRIDGGTGFDRIDGGRGDDLLITGAPTPDDVPVRLDATGDPIEPDPPFDYVTGGPGNDVITGLAGEGFAANGDEGNDSLTGSRQTDELIGGPGADLLRGAQGEDFLYGGDFTQPLDQLTAFDLVEDSAADTLLGGANADVLLLQGKDVGTGGDGADVFAMAENDEVVAPGERITVTDFEPGEDRVLLFVPDGATATASVEDYLAAQQVTAAGVEIALGSGAVLVLQGLTTGIGSEDLLLVARDEVAI